MHEIGDRRALQRSIDEHQRELARAVAALGRATVERLDLRREIDRRPWAFVVAGLAFGLWLGTTGRGR